MESELKITERNFLEFLSKRPGKRCRMKRQQDMPKGVWDSVTSLKERGFIRLSRELIGPLGFPTGHMIAHLTGIGEEAMNTKEAKVDAEM